MQKGDAKTWCKKSMWKFMWKINLKVHKNSSEKKAFESFFCFFLYLLKYFSRKYRSSKIMFFFHQKVKSDKYYVHRMSEIYCAEGAINILEDVSSHKEAIQELRTLTTPQNKIRGFFTFWQNSIFSLEISSRLRHSTAHWSSIFWFPVFSKFSFQKEKSLSTFHFSLFNVKC